jgi:hypothetical protein
MQENVQSLDWLFIGTPIYSDGVPFEIGKEAANRF